MNAKRKVFSYLIAGLAVVLLAAGATVAYAQTLAPDMAAGDYPSAHRGWGWPGRLPGGPLGGSEDHDPLLAEALGIRIEELEDAQAAAQEAALAEAVADGQLTQEQADWLVEGAGFGFLGRKGIGPRGFGTGSDYQTLLAEALGIQVEELQAAQQTARTTGLAQAVEEGRITAEQAELIQAKQALMDYIDKEALMAEALGISVEELQDFKAEGTRLSDLIEELGLEAEVVSAQMDVAYQAALEQAVAEGVITQELADQIGMLGRFGFGSRGFARPGNHGRGFHGAPGWGNGQPDLDSSL